MWTECYHPKRTDRKNFPFGEPILECAVAGTCHVINLGRALDGMKIGDRVWLVREPYNKHDYDAVRIESIRGYKLGYIPKDFSKMISGKMDEDKKEDGKVLAIVRSIAPGHGAYVEIKISVYNVNWK